MTENGAYDMLDYIITLREGIMDAWSGIILALKQNKGLCRPSTGLQPLITTSAPIGTICGSNLQITASHITRPKPE